MKCRINCKNYEEYYQTQKLIKIIEMASYISTYTFQIPIIAMSGFTQSSMIALAPLIITALQCQWNTNIPLQVLLLFVLFFGGFPGNVLSGVSR